MGGARRRDERLRQNERRQIGVREVPIVLRLLLAAEAVGRALVFAPAARLLNDAPAGIEYRRLPLNLVRNGAFDEAKGVDVLELDPRAELRLPERTNADVGVAAEAPSSRFPSFPRR